MRHPTLILLRLSAVLSVNYLICRRIRCCLPKPAEIEINAPGALVVISVGRASCARSVKHSSLWNLSSNERDFFFFSFFLSLHQILLVHTPNVWIARTKEGQQLSKAVLWECCDWWRLKTNSTPKTFIFAHSLWSWSVVWFDMVSYELSLVCWYWGSYNMKAS